jgi:hypothetical protein
MGHEADHPQAQPWPTWVWYAMVVVILASLAVADLAGWLAPLDPVRTP